MVIITPDLGKGLESKSADQWTKAQNPEKAKLTLLPLPNHFGVKLPDKKLEAIFPSNQPNWLK